MKFRRHLIFTVALFWSALIIPPSASALIMVGYGNQPVTDYGWPQGALAVANFGSRVGSRVGYWEGPPDGGGEYHFLYRGDNAAFDAALKNFAAIHAPTLQIIVHDGPGSDQFLAMPGDANRNPDGRVDWSFTIWVPESWKNLYNNPKVTFNTNDPNYGKSLPPPRMDVYVAAGGLDWGKITVPANIRVRDERASTVKDGVKSQTSAETTVDASRVEQCLKDFESITNGVTRAQVESKLKVDGGLHSASPVTFVHPACPYFKIKVEFDFKRNAADQNRAVESKDDRVTRVSKPYLERPIMD